MQIDYQCPFCKKILNCYTYYNKDIFDCINSNCLYKISIDFCKFNHKIKIWSCFIFINEEKCSIASSASLNKTSIVSTNTIETLLELNYYIEMPKSIEDLVKLTNIIIYG